MRIALLSCLLALVAVPAADAQSVLDNLPPTVVQGSPPSAESPPPSAKEAPASAVDPYTVSDINADVTADTAAHARDQALMQAERAAFSQLCARLNVADGSGKMNDDAVAALVQSFEVQSERVSAVRYIGVFTIRFKPAAVQKKTGSAVVASAATGPLAHLTVAIQADSLAAWAQIKRRLGAVPQVAQIDTLDLGRGTSHIALSYSGSLEDLKQAVTTQGFVLRQSPSAQEWELDDGSMVPR